MGFAACGGESLRQDADEPKGDFEVKVTTSKFPTTQRLAQTSDLILGVKNTGRDALPQLAFTIDTHDNEDSKDDVADGSFNIRLDDDSLANPNRPVWILESKYPRPLGDPPSTGLGPGLRAQTNTYAFGPLDPGESQKIIWRVTPVMAGNYTLSYLIEAGLQGKAKAVTSDGGEVKGEFVVSISNKPPKATVDDNGNPVTKGP